MKRLSLALLALLLGACASAPPPDPMPVDYPGLSDAERDWLRDGAAKSPPVISVIRSPGSVKRQWRSNELAWKRAGDGRYARMRVTSPGASAVTLGICVRDLAGPVDISVDEVPVGEFAGVSLSSVADLCERGSLYWLPMVKGDSATLRFTMPAGEPPEFLIELRELRHRR